MSSGHLSSLQQNKHAHGRLCDRTDSKPKRFQLLGSRMITIFRTQLQVVHKAKPDNRSPAANDSSTRFHSPVVLRSTARSSPMDVASHPQSSVLFVATFLSLFLLPFAQMAYTSYVLEGSTDVHLVLIVMRSDIWDTVTISSRSCLSPAPV